MSYFVIVILCIHIVMLCLLCFQFCKYHYHQHASHDCNQETLLFLKASIYPTWLLIITEVLENQTKMHTSYLQRSSLGVIKSKFNGCSFMLSCQCPLLKSSKTNSVIIQPSWWHESKVVYMESLPSLPSIPYALNVAINCQSNLVSDISLLKIYMYQCIEYIPANK